MKIYRWLNDQGNGLYQDGFPDRVGLIFGGVDSTEDIPYYHPPLYEDVRGFKFKDLDRYFCAFLNIDQMMGWFRDIDVLTLFVEGGKLLEITVAEEDVLTGQYQCIYLKHRSANEREIGIDEFIEIADSTENKWREFWD